MKGKELRNSATVMGERARDWRRWALRWVLAAVFLPEEVLGAAPPSRGEK